MSEDTFLDEWIEAMSESFADEWDEWYAEYGGRPGVVFDGGPGIGDVGIPSMLDSMRFSIYREKGLEAMREFEERFHGADPSGILKLPLQLPEGEA